MLISYSAKLTKNFSSFLYDLEIVLDKLIISANTISIFHFSFGYSETAKDHELLLTSAFKKDGHNIDSFENEYSNVNPKFLGKNPIFCTVYKIHPIFKAVLHQTFLMRSGKKL